MTATNAQLVPATGTLHQEASNPIFRQPQDIFDHAPPLAACQRLRDAPAYAGNAALAALVRDAAGCPWRFLGAGWSVPPLGHPLASQWLCRAWRWVGPRGRLSRHLCGVSCARGAWTARAHWARVGVDQPQGLVSLRLLLAAVMRLGRQGGRRMVAVAFRPVHGPSWPACEPQGRGRHGARGPCWRPP
jgi:hypothetical protein